MKLMLEDPELGKYYHDEESGKSAFEKTLGLNQPRFCAWEGAWEEYRDASRTPWSDTMDEVVGYLEFQQFRCTTCGKMRSRKPGKKWSDHCREGGVHDWVPMPGKKKTQPGRKINMWMSDAQLLEIEKLSDVTGNDRASTIRDLISLGLKCRQRMDTLMGVEE